MAKKVLVVDDEKLIVKGIRFSLEQDGMEVTCAYDGEEALHLAQENKFDMILLDIILNDNCSSCKEIYYKASKLDHKIGTATVYRMVNTLEEIGAISRHNMYRIDCGEKTEEQTYDIELDDHTIQSISESTLNNVLQAGLKACGYIDDQNVKGLILQPSVC